MFAKNNSFFYKLKYLTPWTRQTIRNPSDKFQMLLYPWIENDFSSDYNASPLRSEKTASSQRSVLRLIDSEKAKNNTKC